MTICEYCDSHLEDGTTTCPNCGAKVPYTEPAVEEEPPEAVVLETEQTEPAQEAETRPLKEFWEDLTGGLGQAAVGGATLLGSLFGKRSHRAPLHSPRPDRHPAPGSSMHSRGGRPGGPGLHRGGFGGNRNGGMGGGRPIGMGGPHGRR